MRRSVFLLTAGLWLAAGRPGTAQVLDASEDRPRFLIVAATGKPPVDASDAPVLRRRVTVALSHVPLGEALQEVGRQVGVRFAVSPDMIPVDARVSLRVNGITLGAALYELLSGRGLDVQFSRDSRGAAIVRRGVAASAPIARVGSIVGRVVAVKTGTAVAGADVFLDRGRWRTTTDSVGGYRLVDVDTGTYTLSVRRLGYAKQSQNVVVQEGRTDTVDFALEARPVPLNDLVSTATGQQRRRDIDNSITTIQADSVLRAAPIKSITDLLEGRVPGLTVQHTSGAPGDPSKLRLRGIGSVTRNNDPVVVVDGVRIYAAQSDARSGNLTNFDPGARDTVIDGVHQRVRAHSTNLPAPSPLDRIDPNIIEKVEIFKGPSAATLYGPDAANGVIVITTKRGKPGPTQWNASFVHSRTKTRGEYPTAYFRWGHVYYNNAPTFCTLTNNICEQDSLVQLQILNDPSLTVLDQGHGNNLSLSAGGGTQTLTYSITGTYNNDVGLLAMPSYEIDRFRTLFNQEAPDWMRRPHNYKQWAVSSNVRATVGATADLTLFASVGRSLQQRAALEDKLAELSGTYVDTVNAVYYRPLTTIGLSSASVYGLQSTSAILKDYYIRATDDALTFTTKVTGDWRPKAWLSTNGTAGIDVLPREAQLLLPAGLASPVDSGYVSYATGRTLLATFNLMGELRKSLGAGFVFTTNVGAGLTATKTNDAVSSASGLIPGTTSLAGAQYITATQIGSNQSIFNWSIAPRVSGRTISLSAGFLLSGSSNQGARLQGRGGLGGLMGLPKLGGSWTISDESWFPFRSLFSSLRLRGSYGQSSVQLRPDEHLRLYTASVSGSQRQLVLNNLGNPDLRPERSKEIEGGFDASLLDDRLTVDLTLYRKLQVDEVRAMALPPSVNGGGTINANVGNVLNRGLELELGVTPVRMSTLVWNLDLLFSHNKNTLSKLGEGVSANASDGLVEGYSIGGRWARPILGYADQNGDGVLQPQEIVIGDSLAFMGSSQPTALSTLHSNLRLFNTIRVTAAFNYITGGTQLDQTARTNWVLARPLVDRSVSLSEQAAVLASTRAVNPTDYGLIHEVSTFRFQSLSVNYQMPSRIARLFRAQQMEIAVQGSNLALHSTYGGRDPNVTAWIPGDGVIDTGQLAEPRLWQLRVDLRY